MTRKLTAAGEAVLDSKTVPIKFSVKIAGVANPDVINYDYRFDRNFGASSLAVTLLNEDGKYGPGQPEEIEFGTTVELEEGLYITGGHEDFNRFYGIARQIRPSIRQGQSIIVITAYDYIIKLEDWEIEKEFEATKIEVKNEKLSPVRLPAPESSLAQIFNAAHNDWAEHPLPIIKIYNKTNKMDEPLWQGFEINYAEGQVILGTVLDVDSFDLYCSYHYYPSGKFVEDIIEEIITTPDGYGNSFSTTTYLRESFTSFTGLSTDIMTPNYVEEKIDGTTYAAGKCWYTSYNNLTTNLVAGNFTVPGASIQRIDKRYGRIRLNHAISLTSVVTCNVNYSFKTIQASGIEVPYINFTSRKTKNRFEALRQIRELVAPNYLIRTIGTKKIWAAYINQKYNPDYTLKLTTALNYAEDQDISTRVKVFGKNLNPTNLMLGREVHFEEINEEYTGYSYQQELTYWSGWGDLGWDPTDVEVIKTPDVYDEQCGRWEQWDVGGEYPGCAEIFEDEYRSSPDCVKFDSMEHRWEIRRVDNYYPHYYLTSGIAKSPVVDIHSDLAQLETNGELRINFYMKVMKRSEEAVLRAPHRVEILITEYDSAYSSAPEHHKNTSYISYENAHGNAQSPINDRCSVTDFPNCNSYNSPFSYQHKLWEKTYFVRIAIRVVNAYKIVPGGGFVPWRTFCLTSTYLDDFRAAVNEVIQDDAVDSKEDYLVYKVYFVGGQDLTILGPPEKTIPEVFINGVKVGQPNPIFITSSQVLIKATKTWDDKFDYQLCFSHSSIDSNHKINIYKADGSLFDTLYPDDQCMDYAGGFWKPKRKTRWEEVEQVATASYWVRYDAEKVEVDYDAGSGTIRVHKDLINRQQRTDIVTANFYYRTMPPALSDVAVISDGRWTTQMQLEFYGQPLKSQRLFTVDLGSSERIDAIDITSGFYKPEIIAGVDEVRRFDISNWFTLEYSLNGSDFYPVCGKANNFHLGGGESISFEEGDIPELFEARYFRFILEESNKIDFENGRWCVALCEFAVYKDLILKGEARLVSSHSEEDETHLYDYRGLLDTVGDKLFKIATVNPLLSTQPRMDRRVGRLLGEFQKDHTKASVDVMYAPHIELGQTVNVINPVTGGAQDYFIEGISNNKGKIALNLAYYPGLYS